MNNYSEWTSIQFYSFDCTIKVCAPFWVYMMQWSGGEGGKSLILVTEKHTNELIPWFTCSHFCQEHCARSIRTDLSAVLALALLRAPAFSSRSFVICLIWLKLVGRCSSADRGTGPISLLLLLVVPVMFDTVSAENDFFNRRWRASSIILALVFQSSELLESPESSKMQSSTKSEQFIKEMNQHQRHCEQLKGL